MTKDEALRLALEALEIEEAQTHYPSQWLLKAITAIKEALAQPAQEPVAWYRDEDGIRIYYESKVWDDATPLYTTPPQRTWVGLTKEEIAEFDTWHDNREEEKGWVAPSKIVAYISEKLRSKNT